MLERNTDPSPKELAWFGLALLAFFLVIGGVVWWRTDSLQIPRILWGVGVGICLLYYAVPPIRRSIFIGWTTLTYPLGWLLTHAILAFVYYGLVTPAGLVMHLVGRDPMTRSLDPEASSYWIEREQTTERSRYFRQF